MGQKQIKPGFHDMRMNSITGYMVSAAVLLMCCRCTGDHDRQEPSLPVYSGEALRNIFYPVGGIGTGDILMGGRGNILEMEIFNRPARDELPPYMTFFSLWFREGDRLPVAMVLERAFFDDFPNGFGLPRQQLSGLPRFAEVSWSGAPPFVTLQFGDRRVPLEISLECFNPLIPLDVPGSSMPVAEFSWVIRNPGDEPVVFSLAFQLSNPFKNLNYRDEKPAYPIRNTGFRKENYAGIFFENLIDPEDPDFGTMVVATDHDAAEILTGLRTRGWWDDAHILWEAFSGSGALPVITGDPVPGKAEKAGPAGGESITDSGSREVVSSLLVRDTLEPGRCDTVRYILAWHVPNRRLEETQAFGAEEIRGSLTRNHYAAGFDDARDVLGTYMARRESLRGLSRRFFERLISSSVPSPVVDAAASNLATLKSNLISRIDGGHVHCFEGLGNDFGCCPGNCTHVWNYAQTMASLFPSLEREMRETAFLTQTFSSGYQCFRTTFPIGEHHFRNVAADGQMGSIMRVYREWKFSGDSLWLAGLWPAVKRSLEYAWTGPQEDSREAAWASGTEPWDPGREGVLHGRQHNTYDIDFYGANMLTGSLYLGALRACREMAGYLGDSSAARYRRVYESGRATYDSLLWNGSFYIQETEEGHDRYQYGPGCLSDQLLGQYLAFNSGMGYLLDSTRVRKCLGSVYRNNFIRDFSDFQNVQRVYALNHEAGLVLCSWPEGDRERIPFPYADEVWTGVEYQVAASLIRAGLVSEGLEIVGAVRNRYGGYNRNPYAEIESGFYYARALSSWSVLPALSGFSYDGARHCLSFDPAIHPDDFTTFWSCGTGWGNFSQTGSVITLELDYGQLLLQQFGIGGGTSRKPSRLTLNGKEVPFEWEHRRITLKNPLMLRPNDRILISLKH
jgi:non-lysosomal glucosylceramidase